MTPKPPGPAATLQLTRLLFGGMISGLLAFGAIVLVLLKPERDPSPGAGNLVLVAFVLAVAALVAGLLLRRVLARPAATGQRASMAAAAGQWFVMSVVSAALAEGVGIFGLIVLLFSGRMEVVVVPAACLVALALLLLLAESSLRAFVWEATGVTDPLHEDPR